MNNNSTMRSLFSLIGAITVIATAVFFLLRHLDNRAHEEKWKDYFECGIL
ncbi:MAG: hypothetical protein ACERKO_02495 [Acetanaerobacterium sp.]